MQNKKNINPEPFHERRVLNLRQARLEELVSDLSKTRDNLGGQIRILTKAMESTADGIFIVNVRKPDFPITYANRSFLAMTGYEKNEIIGRNYFLLYGPDADPHIVDEIKLRINQGISFHGGLLIFKKNGEKCWNLLHITPVRDSAGFATHYVGIQTDVTATRKRDMEIKEQREELLHVTRVGKLAEFVSSLAHEISQPLTAILSYSQAAQRILADREPQISEIFQYIINDDHRATEVIRRLRSLLKKTMPEIKPLDINSIIDDTIGLIAADITIRNILLKTELGNNLPPVHGDRVQLQQVLLNLISNSLDAMENTQNSNEILISTSNKDNEMIVVLVKDSGCGIPSQNINKIFSHFFTSKPDGLGMGLSISRSIVESHGGQLNVENNPDRGATFYFTIPAGVKGEL